MADVSTITVNNSTYNVKDTTARAALVPATTANAGLMSADDKSKLNSIARNATANSGTLTGITMNGEVVGTTGMVDLGTVLTEHQDISSKAEQSTVVTNVGYNSTNKKITKTINSSTTDVVTVATLKTAMSLAKSDVGLGNVENKSASTILGEMTSTHVTNALGYTPPESDTTYTLKQDTNNPNKLIFKATGANTQTEIIMPDNNTWTELSTSAGGYVGTPLPNDDTKYLNGLGGWTSPPSSVTSVAGQTGVVVLSKGDVGLGNVNNTSDANKPISTATQTALDAKLDTSLKGAANGLAELDANGKVPAAQLPAYVDDVLEYSARENFPIQGESGKIYVALDTNLTYRWSSTTYVEISSSLALGETASTAYAGDKGAAAYAHAVTNKGIAKTSGLYKITTNSEGHVTAATAVQKSDITGLGIPGSDTTYVFDKTYDASTNKAATVESITTRIAALGAAKDKGVITGISSSNATSTDLPTTAAVVAYVTGQGYLTAHQDITGKADKAYTVSSVDYNGTSKKITKTINGTTSDVLTVETLKTDLNLVKGDVGLGNVENKSSATIRGELTATNVTTALNYTPIANDTVASSSTLGLIKTGFTTNADSRNYAVQLSSQKAYVNVPWTDTDTTVTEAANHYTPETAANADVTASATGATAAWSMDVVKGITINTDGKGHITGMTVTSGKTPANPWTAMTGATSSANGTVGYIGVVPPKSGYNTKFWCANGTWAVPPGTYSLPVAASDTLGGIKLGYTQTDHNYPVELSGQSAFVTVPWTDTTYTFDGTYSATTNKAATVSTVTNAIAALDGNLNSTTPGAGKTLTAFSQTDGVVSATFGNISITKSQISDFPTTMTPASHTHGNITNAGALQTNDITIASGDKLVVTDSSDSSKVARTSISFDASTATKCLTQKGTWESFNNYSHPTGAGNNHIPTGGSSGQFLKYSASGTAAWSALPTASTSASGIVSLSSSLTSSSETVAATSKAVQTLNNNFTSLKNGSYSQQLTGKTGVNLVNGLYWCENTSDTPEVYGEMIVINHSNMSNYWKQIFFPYASNKIYTRTYSGSSLSSWVQIGS